MALRVDWSSTLSGADAEAYDRFVLVSPGGHYAQTRAWEPVARASRPCRARYARIHDGERLVGTALLLQTVAGPVPLPVASVDRGPVVASPDDAPAVLAAFAAAARAHGIARLRVMPYWAGDAAACVTQGLAGVGFHDVHLADCAHACTLRLDIQGKPDDVLFAGKAREQVRWRAKQATKMGATARRGERADLDAHRALYRELMSAQGKGDKSAAWYEALWAQMLSDPARGALFVSEHEGRVIGTAVVLRHGQLVTYVYGATSSAPLKFSKAILALVLAIKWARDEGCTTFDLGGVPPEEDTDPKRAAIATFKFDFDKTRVRLVREHARWF